MVAAAIAAWMVKHLPARVLGVAAGGLIVLTNTRTVAEALGADGSTTLWIIGIAWAVTQDRRTRQLEQLEAAYAGA